jgi:hypothetical protein
MKIEKQTKKKLKIELTDTKKWLRMSLVFGLVYFWMTLILRTMLMCKARQFGIEFI